MRPGFANLLPGGQSGPSRATAGRGRMYREHKAHRQAIQDIYVYPLVRDARLRLSDAPHSAAAGDVVIEALKMEGAVGLEFADPVHCRESEKVNWR